jgi:hypothetical protein
MTAFCISSLCKSQSMKASQSSTTPHVVDWSSADKGECLHARTQSQSQMSTRTHRPNSINPPGLDRQITDLRKEFKPDRSKESAQKSVLQLWSSQRGQEHALKSLLQVSWVQLSHKTYHGLDIEL